MILNPAIIVSAGRGGGVQCMDLYHVTNRLSPEQGAQLTDGEVQNSFDQLPQHSLDSMLQGKTAANVSFYDDTALCASAFR